MDSLFEDVATAIDARSMNGTIMDTSIITLDNIGVQNVDTMIAFTDGYKVSIPAENTKFVVVGNVGKDGATGMYARQCCRASSWTVGLYFSALVPKQIFWEK